MVVRNIFLVRGSPMLELVILLAIAFILLGPRRNRLMVVPTAILVLAVLFLYFRAMISVWEFVLVSLALILALGLGGLARS